MKKVTLAPGNRSAGSLPRQGRAAALRRPAAAGIRHRCAGAGGAGAEPAAAAAARELAQVRDSPRANRGGLVRIEGCTREGLLELSVIDDGLGFRLEDAPDGRGAAGLRNTRERPDGAVWRAPLLHRAQQPPGSAGRHGAAAGNSGTGAGAGPRWGAPGKRAFGGPRRWDSAAIIVDGMKCWSRRGVEIRGGAASDFEILTQCASRARSARRHPAVSAGDLDLP